LGNHQSARASLAEWLVIGRLRGQTISRMRTCPICGTEFNERAFQIVIRGPGAFDSIACLEEGARRERRRTQRQFGADLLDAAPPRVRVDELRQPSVDRSALADS
jgi:hypothetical protein